MSVEKEAKLTKTEKAKKEVVQPLELTSEKIQKVFVDRTSEVVTQTNEVEKKKSLIVKGYSRVDRSFRKNNK